MADTVVVLGATGGLGRGITSELLAAGHAVIAVARDSGRLAGLARELGEPAALELVRGSVSSDEDASRLMADLAALGHRPRAVVASICGRSTSARMLDQPAAFLRRALDEDVVAHFVAARHLIPLMAESGRETLYLMLSGPAAECAWAGYGHLSVAAAALRMLTLVAKEEAKDLPVRVQQLQVCRPVRTGRFSGCECPEWLAPEQVGRRVVELVEGADRDAPVIRFGGYDQAVESPRTRTTIDSERIANQLPPRDFRGGAAGLEAGSGTTEQRKGD